MTGKMINAGGIPLMTANTVTSSAQNFYISYNDRDINIYGSATTALVRDTPTKFLILKGNHTAAYEDIISAGGDYDACVRYFIRNMDQKAKHSENWDEMMVTLADGRLKVVKDEPLILRIGGF